MADPVALPAQAKNPYLAIAQAVGRSWWARRALPPGDLVHIDRLERGDRALLLKRAATYGPVFKGLAENRLLVCVVGLAAGRRLLKAHAASLRPVTLELAPLFPQGFMRQMEGDTHRAYRKALVRALGETDLPALEPAFDTLAAGVLASVARAAATPQAWSAALAHIASSMLVCVFFGAPVGSARHGRLLQAYQRLGPHGLVWNITARQATAFAALRDELRAQAAARPDAAFAAGLLGRAAAQGPVDDTLLGNLIYMVEAGRYDLGGLLRWLCWYAAEQPAWLERIALESAEVPGPSAAEAFVLETLRAEKSERLMRHVLSDFVFEGYLIPKGAQLRICMWESHHDEAAFMQPFAFDPARFMGAGPAAERFQPFGLDHHHCPFSGLSIRLGVVFLRALARGYRVSAVARGAPVRGAYHWEPAPGFALALQARDPRVMP